MKFVAYLVFLIIKIECINLNNNNRIIRNTIANLIKNKPLGSFYFPLTVDWRSVISACKATCRFDRRLCNFYVRAAAHDALSIFGEYGGSDGSLMLSEDELRRQENNYDNFANKLSKNVLEIAKRFDASVADVLAVCGGVATEFLGGPKLVTYNFYEPFMVGRFDKDEPNPRTLAKPSMNVTSFVEFAKSRGLTVQDMTALMGSHTLLDEKGCLRSNYTLCNPDKQDCKNDSAMYKWTNIYYQELCTMKTKVHIPAKEVPALTTKKRDRKDEKCRFTSTLFQQEAIKEFDEFEAQENNENETEYINVETLNPIPTAKRWMYTIHDAWMGKACQKEVKDAPAVTMFMNNYRKNPSLWNIDYARAYKKMTAINAKWAFRNGYPITGYECPSGYISTNKTVNCKACNVNFWNIVNYKCDESCRCKTELSNTARFYDAQTNFEN